jgi:hypothetical protein
MSLRAQALLSFMCTSAAHCVTSGFRREKYGNYCLLGYYAASIGHFLLTFRVSLSVPSIRMNDPSEFLTLVHDTSFLYIV